MPVSAEVRGLEEALKQVRARLLEKEVTDPGFGEVRAMYNDLTNVLIRAALKEDKEVAERLNVVAKEIAEEWETSSSGLGDWAVVLKDVVGKVGTVLGMAGIPNPLGAFAAL